MARMTLTRPDRFYLGSPRSIAARLLRDQGVTLTESPGYKYLLTDTAREVEYHGEEVPAQGVYEVFITVFDADGEEAELPLDHPLVDTDTLKARRDDVRDVFLPDAYDNDSKQMYANELQALRRELQNRGT